MGNLSNQQPARPVSAAGISRDSIFELVAEPLVGVDALFRESLASPVEIVHELGEYVAESGGKRVRPTLHLLCSKMIGYEGPNDVVLATVLEFIHAATLIHDDVIDHADTRRGRPAMHQGWGSNVSVLFGDYLLAKAMELALQAKSLRVMEKLASVTLRMTEGEMLQTRYEGRLDLTEEEYLGLIERKTAALFACCGELAGILGGVSPEEEAALGRYGRHLGLEFQLIDDLLDFTGQPDSLGKPVASDLSEGKATLAVLDLLASGPQEARKIAQAIVERGQAADTEIHQLNRLLRDSGALHRTRERARLYADRAVADLERFPAGPARSALQALPEILLERDR